MPSSATTRESSWRWCPRQLAALAVLWALAGAADAQVFRYEGVFFPEQLQWERIVSGTPERQQENGWLIETLEYGDRDFYRREIGGISSLVGRFFVEWRAVTDNPEWLIDEYQVPTVVVAGGNGAFYHVVMTESAAALTHFDLTRAIVPISSGEHTYRIEVYSDEYLWYIDGVVVDSGVPVGPYPDPNARLTWGAETLYEGAPTATTAFDYVRFGQIPEPASGDFDSDGAINAVDYRFTRECLSREGPDLFGGPGQIAGPGCSFTDFDTDGDADLLDFSEFANHYTGTLP